MIRINLLPRATKKVGASGNDQVWFAGYVGAVLVLCGLLAFLYLSLDSELQELTTQNQVIKDQIAQVKKKVGDLDEVKKELARSRELEKVVGDLMNKRGGAARTLMELSNILSPGVGPSVDPEKLAELRKDNPAAGYSTAWDVRRLWLDSFEERKGKCKLRGVGKSNEDVAEFLRRLEVSEMFSDVRLTGTRSTSTGGVGTMAFDVKCKVGG